MFKFAHTNHLFALILVGVVILLFILYWINRKQIQARIGNSLLIAQLSPKASMLRKSIKFGFLIFAFVFLVIAWANPLLGKKFETVKREGIDVIFAIDVSTSMNAVDIVPSRMLKARQIVSNLIDEMSNDRIGLIVFAGNAYLQMPVTVDYSGAKMYLKTVDTDMVPKQGTAISDAVALALESYDPESEGYKTLVILSDGEDHDGDALSAVKKAKEQGVTVHTIGVGSNQAAKIPLDNKGNYKTDGQGNVVETKLNKEMLAELANIGGGAYFSADKIDVEENILLALSGQDGRMIDEKVFTSFKNHFPTFLSIAFVLLLIDFGINERKSNKLPW